MSRSKTKTHHTTTRINIPKPDPFETVVEVAVSVRVAPGFMQTLAQLAVLNAHFRSMADKTATEKK